MKNERYEGTDKLIEVGDYVIYRGEVDEVTSIIKYADLTNSYQLRDGCWREGIRLEYLNKPHKYRAELIAIANGVDVEIKGFSGRWYTLELDGEYRIKPTTPSKSPKQLEKERIQKEMEKLAKDLEELEL